jgi:uncharacterized protein YciI
MRTFVWIGHDGPHGLERRGQHRPAHLGGLEPLAEQGRIRFAGPLLTESGTPRGSVIVFDAPDLAAARALAARDAYAVHGVFERWEVHETTVVFPRPGPTAASSVTRGLRRD